MQLAETKVSEKGKAGIWRLEVGDDCCCLKMNHSTKPTSAAQPPLSSIKVRVLYRKDLTD